MPQVQVALRALAAGKSVRINDVIAYIITSPSSSSTSASESTAKRAFAPQDVCNTSSTLLPDIDWYLYKQIFPPIERLCAPLPGTDAVQLAECLGLDTKKYSVGFSSSGAGGQHNQLHDLSPLESQIPDEVRFQFCTRFSLKCRYCKHSHIFEGLIPNLGHVEVEGIICPKEGCGKVFSTLTVTAQIEHSIRLSTSRYYDAWLVCDDPSCGMRTRQMSVYGHRCLGPRGRAEGCLGKMRYEIGERELYNQLLYFRKLWDVDAGGGGMGVGGKVWGKLTEAEREKCKVVGERNRERFETCRAVVEGYLGKCGRVWVQMDELFGFMLR